MPPLDAKQSHHRFRHPRLGHLVPDRRDLHCRPPSLQ